MTLQRIRMQKVEKETPGLTPPIKNVHKDLIFPNNSLLSHLSVAVNPCGAALLFHKGSNLLHNEATLLVYDLPYNVRFPACFC